MTTRQRRGQSPAADPQEKEQEAEFLDEADQEQLIEDLKVESVAQQEKIVSAFRCILGLAMLVSIAYPFLSLEECADNMFPCGSHAVWSVAGHALTWKTLPESPATKTTQFLLVTSLLVPLALVGVMELSHTFHGGLWIGNAVTILGLVLIQWDSISTDQAFSDLQNSKYKYKDL